jgi:hypothetical protein
MEKIILKNPEYKNFKLILNGRNMLFPGFGIVLDNLLLTHFAFEHKKMGINLWLERDMVPKTNKINRIRMLDSQILKLDGWEILNLSWEEYYNLGDQNTRDKFIHDWYYTTSMLQEKKGLTINNPKYV